MKKEKEIKKVTRTFRLKESYAKELEHSIKQMIKYADNEGKEILSYVKENKIISYYSDNPMIIGIGLTVEESIVDLKNKSSVSFN
jgi:hypothetical protein